MKIASFSSSSKTIMVVILRQDDISTFKSNNYEITNICSEEYVQKRIKKATAMITDHTVPVHLYLDSDNYFIIASPEDYVRVRAIQEILSTPLIESIVVTIIVFPDRKAFSRYINDEHTQYIEHTYAECDLDEEDN